MQVEREVSDGDAAPIADRRSLAAAPVGSRALLPGPLQLLHERSQKYYAYMNERASRFKVIISSISLSLISFTDTQDTATKSWSCRRNRGGRSRRCHAPRQGLGPRREPRPCRRQHARAQAPPRAALVARVAAQSTKNVSLKQFCLDLELAAQHQHRQTSKNASFRTLSTTTLSPFCPSNVADPSSGINTRLRRCAATCHRTGTRLRAR